MAKSIAQIQSQIAKLQKVAEALRAKKVAAVVAKIKSMMAAHGLSAADLDVGKAVATAKKAIRRAKAVKAVKAETKAATRATNIVKPVKAAAATKAAKPSRSAAKSGAIATAKTTAKATRQTGE